MASEAECVAFIEQHGEAIMKIAGVQGLGIGAEPRSPAVFHVTVYVATASEDVLSLLPALPTAATDRGDVEVPVVVQAIGQLVVPSRVDPAPARPPADPRARRDDERGGGNGG
jgi:hypothetical protein